MRLVHFSDTKLLRVERREQTEARFFHTKPTGLWVSDEGAEQSWSKWCRDEGDRDTSAQIAYGVELASDHGVLHLESADALAGFTADYGAPDRFGVAAIDWARVARHHRGVIITPYVWECRLGLSWYYAWDCASGCIWDPDAILSIRMLEASR